MYFFESSNKEKEEFALLKTQYECLKRLHKKLVFDVMKSETAYTNLQKKYEKCKMLKDIEMKLRTEIKVQTNDITELKKLSGIKSTLKDFDCVDILELSSWCSKIIYQIWSSFRSHLFSNDKN